MKRIRMIIVTFFLMITMSMPLTSYTVYADDDDKQEEKKDDKDDKEDSNSSSNPKMYQPNFENLRVWGDDNTNNPYTPGFIGQCTWFAWNCMSEFYGSDFHPAFSGDGQQCASQLAANDPNFTLSDTPKPGAIFSAVGGDYGHVGFVINVNEDGTCDTWDANYNGKSETSLAHFLSIDGLTNSPSGKDYCFRANRTIQDIATSGLGTSQAQFAIPSDEFLKTANFSFINNSNKDDDNKELERQRKELVKEWDLTGMPVPPLLCNTPQSPQSLAKLEDLTMQEQIQLQNLKESIKLEKQAKSRRMFSSMIAMLGLVLSIYSILLLVAFYFDKSNVFLDLSLVSFLTFGKLRIEDDDFHYRGTTDGVRHMSSKDFHIFVFLLIGFSIAWTAGLVQQVMIFILDKIMSFF